MKRLNRKGFTLVELLAVIVILAIVVGITLVTVLPTLKKSRQSAFELTAQTVADYLEKQYQLSIVGTEVSGDVLEVSDFGTVTSPHDILTDEYSRAGVKPGNYSSGTWYINTNTGRACVTLNAATNSNVNPDTGKAGDYYDVNPDTATSTGCEG